MTYHHLSHGRFRASVFASHKETTTYKLIEDFVVSSDITFPKQTLVEFSNALVNVPIRDVNVPIKEKKVVYEYAGTPVRQSKSLLRKQKKRYKKRSKPLSSSDFVPRGRQCNSYFGLSDNMVRHMNRTQ